MIDLSKASLATAKSYLYCQANAVFAVSVVCSNVMDIKSTVFMKFIDEVADCPF